MKKVNYIIIILFFHSFVYAQSGWKVQNPLPTESCLLTVETVTDNVVFIGGLGGTLVKTSDAGNTWTVKKFNNLVDIRSIEFTDPLNGWLLDSRHLLRTNDGGESWNEVSIDADMTTYFFMNIICFNKCIYLILKPQTVYVWELPDAKSLVYKSIDGGKTWIMLKQELKGKITGAFFLTETTGFILADETVSISEEYTYFYKTDDGGTTWDKMKFTGGNIGVTPALHFLNNNSGFAGKYRTTDGGVTWKKMFNNLDSLNELVNDIFFTDSLNGWAVSGNRILQTTNGGLSWLDSKQYSTHELEDINFSKNGTGWIAGYACNILRKKPGGDFWEQLSVGVRHDLNSVFFINKNEGWCAGTFGCIMHTSNGGDTWEKQTSNTDSVLIKIKFLNELEGWAVGYYVVLHTTDGGKNWIKRSDLPWWFVDIIFFDKDNGLLIERFGAVLRTTDGGISWNAAVSKPLTGRLISAAKVNDNEAWIGGWAGLAHSTGKGSAIQWYDVPILSMVKNIQFVDDNNAFLCNDMGMFMYSNDGGWTWKELPRGEGADGFVTTFYSPAIDTAWIYSGILSGYLKQVTSNHTLEISAAPQYWASAISSIFFINSNTGWAVGAGGTILKYTNYEISGDTNITVKSNSLIFNYPNPFRTNGTSISFSLKSQQHVSIYIYNSIGQRVYTLFDGLANNGTKTYTWKPGTGISAGMYFITVRCSDFNQVMKCILLK